MLSNSRYSRSCDYLWFLKRCLCSMDSISQSAGGQMIRSQGKYFSKDELNRIVMLLRESDLTLPEIADRMRCSRSAVAAINRRFQVRLYAGKRSQWSVNCQPRAIEAEPVGSRSLDLEVAVAKA